MRKRQIIQYGNTYVIRLSPSDLEDMNLKLGDEVDIEDINKVKELPKSKSNKEMLKEIKQEVKK